jgi:uncharacterized protein YxeA
MKKLITIIVSVVFIILLGTKAVEYYLDGHRANAVVLLGEKQNIQSDIEEQEGNLKSTAATYNVKLVEVEGQKLLVMDKETANGLLKMALFQKITNSQNGETVPLVGLPEFGNNKGVLFAKNENNHFILSGGKQMDFQYGGNVIIGPGRTFADMFAVVDSSTWLSMNGKEQGLGVLHLKQMNQTFITKDFQTVTVK